MTSSLLSLHQTHRLGLEVWVIRFCGRELHTFLSEQIARTKFERIRMELSKGDQ